MSDELFTEDRIRSYHRAFTPDPKFYGWNDWKLPKPITVRLVFYAFVLEVLTLVVSFLPGFDSTVGLIPWPFRVATAGWVAWVLSAARIQGRWFHAELAARVRSWKMPRYVNAWYWGYEEEEKPLQFTKVRVRGKA